MTDPTKPLPEVHYALLFPNQEVPAWALEKMELFNEDEFAVESKEQVETVPVTQIVGTNHARYGNISRWVDMLTRRKKNSNFRLDNWPGFLKADTSDLVLVRIAGTTKHYIYFEGNHRISALKLGGVPSITCAVRVAHPKPGNMHQPIRLVVGQY